MRRDHPVLDLEPLSADKVDSAVEVACLGAVKGAVVFVTGLTKLL